MNRAALDDLAVLQHEAAEVERGTVIACAALWGVSIDTAAGLLTGADQRRAEAEAETLAHVRIEDRGDIYRAMVRKRYPGRE